MKIWLCWFQGEQDSSLSSRDKACIQRWRDVAGMHEVVVLDERKIAEILPEYIEITGNCKHERSLQAKSDLLRLLLLNKYGGIWADTSVYPLVTADEIIQQTTLKTNIFFYSFSKKRTSIAKGDRLTASWFVIATEPNQYTIRTLCDEFTKRFLSAKKWRYFEIHQAYCDLIDSDEQFRASLANMHVLPAESALVLGRKKMTSFKEEDRYLYHQPTLMVKKPSPISLALFPCIDPKTPVKEVIKAIIKIENLQNTSDFLVIPKPMADETLRCLNKISQRKGALSPSLQTKSKKIHQKLLSLTPSQKNKPNKIVYLHIGKCAGTTLHEYLKTKDGPSISHLHLKRVELNEAADHDFIFFIRHPISRFVSAFNHSKRIVEFDTSGLDINRLNHENSYAPKRIRLKMMRKEGIAFTKQYDKLINHFKSAEELAESLFCDDKQERRKAQKLMRLPNEHLFKGIGWYLHDGELIKRFSQNIKFVGCVETLNKDLETASNLFNLNVNSDQIARKRSGLKGGRNQLSEKAIQNLQRWYRDTDFRAIQILHEHGFIKEDIYNYYQLAPTQYGHQ